MLVLISLQNLFVFADFVKQHKHKNYSISKTMCLLGSLHLSLYFWHHFLPVPLFPPPTCFSPPHPSTPASVCLQHLSHSDDSEVENIMHDPPNHRGNGQNHEAHDADGQDRPVTPSRLQPPAAGRAQSDSGSDTSLSQSRSVEFDLPSPISPNRPRSPWALFDPYSTNEVPTSRLSKRRRITNPYG